MDPRIGQIQFTLFSFIKRTVYRYLNLWPALLMFVFCFNSSEYWNIGQYEKKKYIKYIYGNPRITWPVCSNSDFLLESQPQEHLDVSWWCGNHCWLGIFPGCTPYYPQPQVAPNFLKLGSKIFQKLPEWCSTSEVTQICSLIQPFLPFFYQTRCRRWSTIMHFQTTAFCPFY